MAPEPPDKLEPDYAALARKKAAGASDEEVFVFAPVGHRPQAVAPDWAASYKPGSFEQIFASIYQEAFNILVERQHKYGPDNIRNQGLQGVLTRMSDDKINRLKQSLNGQIVNGQIILDPIEDGEEADTFEDGLFDTANYALIMLALFREVWGRPLEEDL